MHDPIAGDWARVASATACREQHGPAEHARAAGRIGVDAQSGQGAAACADASGA